MHSERDWVYYADRMPLTTIVPCYVNGVRARARENMLASNLAKLINSAAALVSIVEENPRPVLRHGGHLPLRFRRRRRAARGRSACPFRPSPRQSFGR